MDSEFWFHIAVVVAAGAAVGVSLAFIGKWPLLIQSIEWDNAFHTSHTQNIYIPRETTEFKRHTKQMTISKIDTSTQSQFCTLCGDAIEN